MRVSEHLEAACEFFSIASAAKTTPVQAQNYFYACINYIESLLGANDSGVHSFSHEDRSNKMILASHIFESQDIKSYDQLITLRNLSGYRGRNGSTVRRIGKIAKHFRTKALNRKTRAGQAAA